ncbi:hypothetical protein G7Y89_g5347 [Cudoniella acicularis]|uniref:Uncharacterized protein n=1 Tax=Cudoniella acicularis TaxID=354080 RepID=A0A8H4RP62_9HELO|nr:hypothetical protein G7Y89_g5347 [Cudoniella acicularis]
MGGITVKKALTIARLDERDYGKIKSVVKGTMFLATPHRGLGVATHSLEIFKRATSLASIHGGHLRSNLLAHLETNQRLFRLLARALELPPDTFDQYSGADSTTESKYKRMLHLQPTKLRSSHQLWHLVSGLEVQDIATGEWFKVHCGRISYKFTIRPLSALADIAGDWNTDQLEPITVSNHIKYKLVIQICSDNPPTLTNERIVSAVKAVTFPSYVARNHQKTSPTTLIVTIRSYANGADAEIIRASSLKSADIPELFNRVQRSFPKRFRKDGWYLATLEQPEDQDKTFTRSALFTLLSLLNRWDNISTDISYRLFLANYSILDIVESELIIIPVIMCQNLKMATHWHFRGCLRMVISRAEVEEIHGAIKIIAEACGKSLSEIGTVSDVEME